LEVFELFFTADLQQKIVDETNCYAKQVMGDVRYSSWTKITREELKTFIGFSILMGINRLPSVDDYWSKDPLLHYSPSPKGSLAGASGKSPGTCISSTMTTSHLEEIPCTIS
jgi:hypothetical protein